jgi:hypothetical protein
MWRGPPAGSVDLRSRFLSHGQAPSGTSACTPTLPAWRPAPQWQSQTETPPTTRSRPGERCRTNPIPLRGRRGVLSSKTRRSLPIRWQTNSERGWVRLPHPRQVFAAGKWADSRQPCFEPAGRSPKLPQNPAALGLERRPSTPDSLCWTGSAAGKTFPERSTAGQDRGGRPNPGPSVHMAASREGPGQIQNQSAPNEANLSFVFNTRRKKRTQSARRAPLLLDNPFAALLIFWQVLIS